MKSQKQACQGLAALFRTSDTCLECAHAHCITKSFCVHSCSALSTQSCSLAATVTCLHVGNCMQCGNTLTAWLMANN